jgi:tetratricopeptide (TPR) repeat protein
MLRGNTPNGTGVRLDSWKEIAAFLGRTVRTVQRWERLEKLPVRRHLHQDAASVYAYVGDLEQWLASRADSTPPQSTSGALPRTRESYFHYVKGCDAMRRRTRAGLLLAIAAFEASLECDTNWAQAHAALMEAYVVVSITEWCPPVEGFSKLISAAGAALSLDPEMAIAHAALGVQSAFFQADWKTAGQHFARALESDSRSAIVRYWHGLVLMNQGRFAESIGELEHAAALDPMSAMLVANIGRPHLCAGDYETASRYFRLAHEVQPTLWLADVFLGWAEEGAERFEEAAKYFERATAASDGAPVATTSLAHATARMGRVKEAEGLLEALLRQQPDVFVPPVRVARIFVALSDHEEAFRWLERARKAGSLANNVYLPFDAAFRPISADPRFKAILQSLNL